MGDDSLKLREDGYIRMNFPVTSLTYHSNLNIILVKTDVGGVHVLDVNSGVILQSSCLSADNEGTRGIEYAAGADRVFVWDSSGIGARTDYNGVLLLHTALQRPLPSSQPERKIKIELVLSEAVLLYQCLQSLDTQAIEGLNDVISELKTAIDAEPVRKGVKAQKWSTVTISLLQSTLRMVATSVVQELKGQNRRVPALAIASAVCQRANELVPCSRDEETRPLMYSEADRKETFKRWPHMDYKWALPARMAQAGFYHQPSPSGDDRAMCFTCLVCLVCWEKSDEPWVEHERHSPNCPFVRGEYTHNVPISVTNATACAVPSPNVTVVSKGNSGDLIATGTTEGKVNVWKFDCGLKLVKFIQLSPYDSIFSGILPTEYNKVWSTTLEKDSSIYGIELTAMAFVGMTSRQEAYPQTQTTESTEKETNTNKAKPSLICAIIVTKTSSPQTNEPVTEASESKALFETNVDKSGDNVESMNSQNEAKSLSAPTSKMLFLLTYDIHSSIGGSTLTTVIPNANSSGNSKPGGSKKVCAVARTDDACIYDEVYVQYSDEDTELPQCPSNLIDEQISNVINLNASSSKDDCKVWDQKQIIFTKHYKLLHAPMGLLPELQDAEQSNMLDFVGKISQLKSWKKSVVAKLTDHTDSVLQQADPISHYLNVNGPLEIADLKFYESSNDSMEKVKMTTFGGSKVGTQTQAVNNSNNDGFESDPPQEEAVSHGVAVQCLRLPDSLIFKESAKVTHLLPTKDKEHLLVVISSVDLEEVNVEDESDNDGDIKMEVDDPTEECEKYSDLKAYLILYKINNKSSICTIEDIPLSVKELPYNESPKDLCLLPPDKQELYSIAVVSIDGALRLYSLPDLNNIAEKRVLKSHFTSVDYCASVERLSVSTKHGIIYFYALNNGEKDSIRDIDEDEFANIDFDMLQRAPRDEVCGPSVNAPIIIANKSELDTNDLQTLVSLTGCYGTNTTVPYSAVVPGFWCELSPAQRPRSDHQNNRTWRLQNTSSTWDEHVLEITLPYSVSLAHIEFAFTLHIASSANLPVILVTLLKQNLHGIGYKKDAAFGPRSESPVQFSSIDSDNISNLDNPINCEEYLQAHNAEILAGPLLLSTGLDLSQQTGSLTLTSPLLYRARGRTFLIHIKTLFDPAKDMSKSTTKSGESSSKKSSFIGCDWLHQISLTVRSTPHTDVPMERQQRIAMLESNSFLNTLCEIAISKDDCEKRKHALDTIIWVLSVRLQRMRLVSTDKEKDKSVETQQLECIKIIEKNVDALIKNCILCGNRSMSKKCLKIILITSEGEKQLPKPWKSTFETTVSKSVCACIPYLGACDYSGALRWMIALGQHVAQHASQHNAQSSAEQQEPSDKSIVTELVSGCMDVLQRTARTLRDRTIPYHDLLRARFGLYGLPLERTIFGTDIPDMGYTPPTVSYSVLREEPPPTASAKPECHLKDLLNLPIEADAKNLSSSTAWWNQSNALGVFAAGLSEAMPLHVTCHVASDGTKLESVGVKHYPAVVNSLPSAGPADTNQLWNVVKDSQIKQLSQDPDSLDDTEISLMECDTQEKSECTEDKLFKEEEVCNIPWGALVSRPPQHTLIVERMHSGARRFIVLDFGHTVRLTDLIIPSCSDLVTLCIDIWVTSEETDCVKLAFAVDISTKHLVLTDLQPPPLCRYMKITTIGRYGMSATKCKIPLGWFYGEIANISNVQASVSALNSLHQDLTCKFRLATGKLIDVLNPYLEMYSGNASHMMAFLGTPSERDTQVLNAYQECIELQQQLHTCTNILNKLQNKVDANRHIPDMIDKGIVTPDSLLQSASTDKLRVICENVVDMLLYLYFQISDIKYGEVREEWCREVSPLVWEWGVRSAGALGTLLARICGDAVWWGDHLADTLTRAISAYDAPPTPLDRCLVVVMYMCRKSLFAQTECTRGVAHAFASRTLQLLQYTRPGTTASSSSPVVIPSPALTAALLTTLASILDVLALPYTKHSRWDWVTGGRMGHTGNMDNSNTTSARGGDAKLHRRKLHKKLLHQMQELENARRGVHVTLEDQQRARLTLKARIAMLGKRSGNKPESSSSAETPPPPRILSPTLAAQLAQALVAHMLAADNNATHDVLLLCAKVVGRLCALSSGYSQLDAQSILGLARLAVTLPPWPRHALTTLLQDLVEYEGCETSQTLSEDWGGSSSAGGASGSSGAGPGGSRVVLAGSDKCTHGFSKPPRKTKGPTVADLLADSFSLNKTIKIPISTGFITTISMKNLDSEEQLTQVAESDDSESSEEKIEQSIFFDGTKMESKNKLASDNNFSNISLCSDSRHESAGGGAGGPGELAVRRALLSTSNVFATAVRATTPRLETSPGTAAEDVPPPQRLHPPLTHTLYDVFRHLALEFNNQMECTFIENVVSLWLTLNGSSWSGSGGGAGSGGWSVGTLPADAPRVRLAADTVTALLRSLCMLDHVSLRCWVLSMQALAWVANLPLLTEGSSQTMGRVVLECEHFVPAIVKFVTINVSSDNTVFTSEPYLSGALVGGGGGASAALHGVMTRVVCSRGAGGALTALRCVAEAWSRAAQPHAAATTAYDLHATLLRLAHPMLQLLAPHHAHYATHAVKLFEAVGQLSATWVREQASGRGEYHGMGGSGGGGSAGEGRLSGMLADVLAGSVSSARRAPLRRAVLLQLLHYCRVLLAVPLPSPPQQQQQQPSSSSSSSGGSGAGAAQCQTDESKAQHSARDTTNVEDERKQQAAKTPCLADSVLQQHTIMHNFYRTLCLCDGMNISLATLEKNLSNLSIPADSSSLKEELYCLIGHMINVASNPSLMVHSLVEFLRRDEVVRLSQGMQHLMIRLLANPETLNVFIEAGGFELAMEKLVAFHQSGPSNGQGLVASLMNYLKLPPQMVNLSTPANSSGNNNKKNNTPTIDAANGLINIAPLCTVSCGNPTAQPADVLLEGGAGTSTRGACAARRVRAAAWSYHFFSVDDASLALTVSLPYAALLHEVHLQPHLTSLATCPGAVAIEAGCGGTLAPLGPPQITAGMTFIRLVVSRPVLTTTVQIRLYKPRDSANMGLLQLRLLIAHAFNPISAPPHVFNNWSSVVFACTRFGVQWTGSCSPAALSALCACACSGAVALAGRHAHRSVLALARDLPHLRPSILAALLTMDAHTTVYGVEGTEGENMNPVCRLVRQVCIESSGQSVATYVQWASSAAENWLRTRTHVPAALLHTLSSVLWTLKEKELLNNLQEMITDDLFELIYMWIKDVPETSMLKKALDSILCSVCYIRPVLFKTLLEHMDIPIDEDDSMESMTDDTKVQGSPVRAATEEGGASSGNGSQSGTGEVAWRTHGSQLRTVAAASMSTAAAHTLLRSRLPTAVVHAIAEFCEAKLTALMKQTETDEDVYMANMENMSMFPNTGVSFMKKVCLMVEWARMVSVDRRFKDWLGGPGAVFWAPLLKLLCYSRHNKESTWQECAQYAQLEEETIRLFYELTVCHTSNQKLFAATLYDILNSQQNLGADGISGFTRALIVRLVLSPERVRVSIRWQNPLDTALEVEISNTGVYGAGGSGCTPPNVMRFGAEEKWLAGVCSHPSLQHHMLVKVPLEMTIGELVTNGTPSGLETFHCIGDDLKCSSPYSGAAFTSVLRSASDTAITSVAEAWELSLAAASASKDKRVKDVKNTTLKNHIIQKKKQYKFDDNNMTLMSTYADVMGGGTRDGSTAGESGSGCTASGSSVEDLVRVRAAGLTGWIPMHATLAQITAAAPHAYGPHVALTMDLNYGDAISGTQWEGCPSTSETDGSSSNSKSTHKSGGLVREFGACGGLALVAARLPRPRAATPSPPAPPPPHDLDWVKIEDPYEEVVELGGSGVLGGGGNGGEEVGCGGVPSHALLALGLLLKLPGYADALLDEGPRAVHLLRLLLGVTHDEDGRNIQVHGSSSGVSRGMRGDVAGVGGSANASGRWSLGTLPFVVVSRLLERGGWEGRTSPEGLELRRALLALGAMRLVLVCLAVFTHHRPNSAENSQSNDSSGKIEEKNQLYWAKGTGFGTGSTQQSWNVEQALMRQKTEEEHVTVLLQVLASYMNPGEKWPPEEGQEPNTETDESTIDDNEENCADLPPEFIDLIANSSLVPAICSYLRNDSVLDMSRHIPLYVCVLRCARSMHGIRCSRVRAALRPLPRLLAQMSRTTNSYATKLKMSKKNIFGKMTYSQRFNSSTNTELSEEDEGLATLIADIQATSALMCRGRNADDESGRGGSSGNLALSSIPAASREMRYIDLMRTMQFDTYEMIAECSESGCGFKFTVPYHFEGTVRSAGERAHPARMKRLAQEAATLATSLPLSYSSSVFVRYDSVRLDVMKVLITGPSDTPYANGCFILDVYFPAEYPAVPMLINLETTGRHSVRFNPNLYNDGKVCLSVLNTWHGRPEEKWNAHTSSFLQVLVSIQSLILVPEPYFNEPGYERSRGTRVGNSASLEYNSNIYQACVRWAMLDHLRNPEPCFKEVIQTHFWIKRNEIMQTVANWITELEGQSGDERTQTSIRLNLVALKRHYVKLQEELAKLPVPEGLDDLDEPFQLPAVPPSGSASLLPPSASSGPTVASTPDGMSPDLGPASTGGGTPGTPGTPPPLVDDMYSDFEKIVSQVLD